MRTSAHIKAATVLLMLLGFAGPSWGAGETGDRLILQGGAGEFYIAALPPGWQLAERQRQRIGHNLAWTRGGESADQASEQILAHFYPALAGIPPERFLERMLAHYQGSCKTVMGGEPVSGEENGFAFAFRLLACTESPESGSGEVALFRVVSGARGLYVMQRLWRVAPFAAGSFPIGYEKLSAARSEIEFGSPCLASDGARPCPPGWSEILAELSEPGEVKVFQVSE